MTLTTLFFILLVAAAALGAMAMLGTNPLISVRAFAACAALALVFGFVVVAGLSALFGPPEITKLNDS